MYRNPLIVFMYLIIICQFCHLFQVQTSLVAVSKAISPGDLGTFVVDVEQLETASSVCSDTAEPVTGVTYAGGCFFSPGHTFDRSSKPFSNPFSTESLLRQHPLQFLVSEGLILSPYSSESLSSLVASSLANTVSLLSSKSSG